MSIYQISYLILPQKGKYTLFEGLNLSSFINKDLFEDDLFWEGLNIKLSSLEKHISQNFEEGESWSKKLKIYGDNDTNCLKIFLENDVVVSISFRINFKDDFTQFLKKIIIFCDEFNFVIVDNDFNVLSNNQNEIYENIKNSNTVKRFNEFFNS